MPESYDVIFASSNTHKYEEAEKILAEFDIELDFFQTELVEIQDDSLSKIALQKAENAYEKCKKPVIVEDDGLFIDSLSGFPGPYSSYIFNTIGNIGIEVKNIVDSWIANNKKIGIVEAVNLIEANYIAWCDEVWLFKVDNNIALERLKNRNNLSQNEAKKRIESQTSWNKRVDYANITIDTDGDINDIYTKVKKLYIDLIKI